MRNIWLLMICLSLTACAAGSGPQSDPAEARAVKAQGLRHELAKIAGAQVAEGEPLVVSFPVGTLFAAGAALPMPGGTGPLDALVTLIKDSELPWQLRVRATSRDGGIPAEQLAETRARVIKLYFKNAGINLRTIKLTAVAEPGAPLELKPIQ